MGIGTILKLDSLEGGRVFVLTFPFADFPRAKQMHRSVEAAWPVLATLSTFMCHPPPFGKSAQGQGAIRCVRVWVWGGGGGGGGGACDLQDAHHRPSGKDIHDTSSWLDSQEWRNRRAS